MEIILHTADISKDTKSLEKVLNTEATSVEFDFVMTTDGVPVWTHKLFPTQLCDYDSCKLTLYEVLEMNNHKHKLMLDFKYIPKHILKSNEFNKLLEYLNKYDEIQIQSLDLSFIKKLKESNYSNFEIGLIINVLSKKLINNKLPNLDFIAISSELWERRNGLYLDKCNTLYPEIKKYAWTWSTREETEERINNFIDKNADGIITDNPVLVKRLIDKRNIAC